MSHLAGGSDPKRREVKHVYKKETYEAPELVSHGNVEDLTLAGGGTLVDVPIGTPVNGNVNNVIGTHP